MMRPCPPCRAGASFAFSNDTEWLLCVTARAAPLNTASMTFKGGFACCALAAGAAIATYSSLEVTQTKLVTANREPF